MIGRDAPNMRGWWQAADGKWYPPHTLPAPPPRRPWWFLVGVAGLALVVLVAVRSSGPETENGPVDARPSPETTSVAATPTTSSGDLPVGARLQLQSGATVQVRSYERSSTGQALIEVEGCASARSPDDGSVVNPFRFVLRLPDGTTVQHGVAAREPAAGFVALAAGECTRGWITFELARNVQPPVLGYASPSGDRAQWRLAG